MVISCIIVTKDRPIDSQRCLTSLRTQTRKPDQIIVVEGGETRLSDVEGIDYVVSAPGITKQRNVARSRVRKDCDVVVYLDDDTVLTSDIVFKVERAFSERSELVGLTGSIVGEAPHSQFKQWLGRLTGLYTSQPYGISWGLFNIINQPQYPQAVQWLPGAFMCYRWSKVKELAFDEWFNEYGLAEDLDFSLRAAYLGTLWVDPSIIVEHHHSRVGRNWYKFGTMRIANRRYIYDKHFQRRYGLWLGMWWANIWLLLINAVRGLGSDRYCAEWRGEVRALLPHHKELTQTSFQRVMRGLTWGVALATFLFGLYFLLVVDNTFIFGSSILYIIILVGVRLFLRDERLVALYRLMIIVNLVFNGWGAFGWYRTLYFYDDFVHFSTPFIGVWIIFVWYAHTYKTAKLPWYLIVGAIILGFVWELTEYYGDQIFNTETFGQADQPLDTVYDIIMDICGIMAGMGLYLLTRNRLLRWLSRPQE